ncbi:hypothetical protein ACQEU3_36565, partial [Spirillospora sp. CA-253888]
LGDDVADQGMYLCENTSTVNLAIPSPPGTGSRTHRVIARVKDKLHNGTWSTYEWTLEVLADGGGGLPALPASAISLARVAVAAGQASVTNAHITDDRVNASLLAGQFPNVAGDAFRMPNPRPGEPTYRTDLGGFEYHNGSSYRFLEGKPGPDQFARKTADETVNNSNTLQNDNHLVVALAANATYVVDLMLIYESASAVPDLTIGFSIPAGATWKWVPRGLSPTDAEQSTGQQAGYIRMPLATGTTSRSIGTQAGQELVVTPKGIIRTGGSAGNLQLMWAQTTQTAENTVIKTDSHMHARRVA